MSISRIPCGAAAFRLPSSAHKRNATIKDGKVETLPSQILSKGVDMVVYAEDNALVESSKGLFESNGSNTAGGGGGSVLIPKITLDDRMAAANAALSSMLCLF